MDHPHKVLARLRIKWVPLRFGLFYYSVLPKLVLDEFPLILQGDEVTALHPSVYGFFRSTRNRVFAWITFLEDYLEITRVARIIITPNNHVFRIFDALHRQAVHSQIVRSICCSIKHWIFTVALLARPRLIIEISSCAWARLDLSEREPCIIAPALVIEAQRSDLRRHKLDRSRVASDSSCDNESSVGLLESVHVFIEALLNTVLY